MLGSAGVRSRLVRRLALLASCALAAAMFAASIWTLTSPASAASGVPIPAPAGTTWSIIAGYNTGTHGDHDGGDPHAIDIVRTDAATDWTPVLSPVDGVVTWHGENCLTIADANGYAHLLCHLEPAPNIQRGLRISRSDHLGRVFPAGYDANGGVAHIHYAIHATRGGGRLERSIPFTGSYALEGRELPWRDEFNLHGGLEFISSNARDWSPPTESSPEPREDTSESEPEPAWTMPADAPVGGWRMVGVHQRTSVAGLFATLDAPLVEMLAHSPILDTYDLFDPTDTDSAPVAIRSLEPGQAVWARVLPDAPWLPPPPSARSPVTLRLYMGPNLISWQGPERDIAEALRNVAHLNHAYQYDPYTDTWRFWAPDAPAALNTLQSLKTGDALFIHVRVGSVWTQLP